MEYYSSRRKRAFGTTTAAKNTGHGADQGPEQDKPEARTRETYSSHCYLERVGRCAPRVFAIYTRKINTIRLRRNGFRPCRVAGARNTRRNVVKV